MKRSLKAFVVFSVSLVSSAAQLAAQESDALMALDGPPLEVTIAGSKGEITPELQREIDAILALDAEFPQALMSKDMDRFSSLLSTDIISLTSAEDPDRPGQPMIAKGREAIADLNQKFFDATPELRVKSRPTEITISSSGDLAFLVGDYILTFEDPEQGRMMDRGRYAFALEKNNDAWAIALHGGTASVWKRVDEDPSPASGGIRVEHAPSRPVKED